MIHGHGGSLHEAAARLGVAPKSLSDLSGNLNPLGPPPFVLDHLKANIETIAMLPDADGSRVADAIGRLFGLDGRRILAGNGTTHFIHTLPAVLKTERALVVGPTYADYRDACLIHGVEVLDFQTTVEDGFSVGLEALVEAARSVDTVFLCNPNNPTGTRVSRSGIGRLLTSCPDTRFVVDETYMPFVPETGASVADLIHENLVVLTSLSKIYRLPGLRIGFLSASGEVLETMKRFAMPWTVNAVAQEAVLCMADRADATRAFVEESRKWLASEREKMAAALSSCRFMELVPGDTIYHLVALSGPLRAGRICRELERRRILIRDCTNILGLSDRFIRFSFGPTTINAELAAYLTKLDRQADLPE